MLLKKEILFRDGVKIGLHFTGKSLPMRANEGYTWEIHKTDPSQPKPLRYTKAIYFGWEPSESKLKELTYI